MLILLVNMDFSNVIHKLYFLKRDIFCLWGFGVLGLLSVFIRIASAYFYACIFLILATPIACETIDLSDWLIIFCLHPHIVCVIAFSAPSWCHSIQTTKWIGSIQVHIADNLLLSHSSRTSELLLTFPGLLLLHHSHWDGLIGWVLDWIWQGISYLLLAISSGLKRLESATHELSLLLLISTASIEPTLRIGKLYWCLWLSHHLSGLLHTTIEGSLLVRCSRVACRIFRPILLHLNLLHLRVHGILIQLRCLGNIQTLLIVTNGSHWRLHLGPCGAIICEWGHLGLEMPIPRLLQIHTQVMALYIALVDIALVSWVTHEQRCGIWSLILDAATSTWFWIGLRIGADSTISNPVGMDLWLIVILQRLDRYPLNLSDGLGRRCNHVINASILGDLGHFALKSCLEIHVFSFWNLVQNLMQNY